jgi:uncharacterized membrane protein
MLFLIIKWIHVLSAIAAVGANITYGIWIARASKEPKFLPFVLRNIKLIDDRVANPCYGLLLLTGLTMAFLAPIPLKTPWLLTGLTLYVIAGLLGAFGFTPIVKQQIQLLDSEGIDSPNYQAIAKKATLLGILVGVDVVIIVFLMVVKPALWG